LDIVAAAFVAVVAFLAENPEIVLEKRKILFYHQTFWRFLAPEKREEEENQKEEEEEEDKVEWVWSSEEGENLSSSLASSLFRRRYNFLEIIPFSALTWRMDQSSMAAVAAFVVPAVASNFCQAFPAASNTS
jgi:hypothetical protein